MSTHIKKISTAFLACLIASPFSHAAVIQFTSGEGFSDGTLDGQPGFEVASNAAGFTVNSTGAGSVSVDPTLSARTAVYQTPTDFTTGQEYTSYIDFSFVQSTATVAANTTMLSTLYLSDSASGSVSPTSAGFGRSTSLDGYRLAAFSAISVAFAGSEIGIDSANSDFTSDVIRITLTLQRGAAANTWIGTETVTNLTTMTEVVSRSSSTINVGATPHADTSLYNGFASNMSTSGISSFTIHSYGSPVSVPEPSSMLLFSAGLGLLVKRRRRTR